MNLNLADTGCGEQETIALARDSRSEAKGAAIAKIAATDARGNSEGFLALHEM